MKPKTISRPESFITEVAGDNNSFEVSSLPFHTLCTDQLCNFDLHNCSAFFSTIDFTLYSSSSKSPEIEIANVVFSSGLVLGTGAWCLALVT